MSTRCAAETTARDVRPPCFRKRHCLGCGRRNIRDAFIRQGSPLAAKIILVPFRIKMIVRISKPRPVRRVIITDARQKIIVGVKVGSRDT